MDIFKQELTKQCDIKGLKCDCCNPSRMKMGTISKRRIKMNMRKLAKIKLKKKMRRKYMENV